MYEKLALVLIIIGLSCIFSGVVTLSYTITKSDEIDGYVNEINKLKSENKILKREYYIQNRELEQYTKENVWK